MIHAENVGGIALLTIDNPPVNATSQAVRQGLLDALTAATADAQLQAIVIIGAGGRFSAGGDVRELGNTALNRPSLLDTIALIESARVPVIAALAGVALGGGLELALACHYRVGAAPLKLGLPEVTLGVIPGAGGTQRLPRLIGAAAALEIISSGRHVDADEALRLGVLDALCDSADELREAAIALARRVVASGQRALPVSARGERIAAVERGLFERYRESHARAWRGALAPWKIVQAIEYCCTRPAEEAMRYERAAYVECQSSPQRAALGHLFAARRLAKKTGLDDARRGPIVERLRGALDRGCAALRARGVAGPDIAGALQHANWTLQALPQLPQAVADREDAAILGSVIDVLVAEARLLIERDAIAVASEIDLVSVEDLGYSAYLGGILFQRPFNRPACA